jgi:hypothetical protein
VAACPGAPGAVHEPQLDAVEAGPDANDGAQGLGEVEAGFGPPPEQSGALVRAVLRHQHAFIEKGCGEFGDAGRAHAEMLADLHPGHGAFPAQGIEQTPAGSFAGREGQRGHGPTLFTV